MTDSASKNLATFYESLMDFNSDYRNKNLYRLLSSYLEGKTFFDIGCGSGHFLNIAHNKGLKVFGIEPNEELISLSKMFYPVGLPISQLAAENIDNINEKFDNIAMIDVLEHVQKDDSLLQKINRIMAKNGRLIILVPSYPFLYGRRDKAVGHLRRYNKIELIRKLELNGYRVVGLRFWNMLGVVPYFIYEKFLGREIDSSSRKKAKGFLAKILNRFLDLWFKYVENKINLGFGLSLIAVCVLNKSGD